MQHLLIIRTFAEAKGYKLNLWSLSDNDAEHEYWLNGEKPNLFDADYLRKCSYKGFCDGIINY